MIKGFRLFDAIFPGNRRRVALSVRGERSTLEAHTVLDRQLLRTRTRQLVGVGDLRSGLALRKLPDPMMSLIRSP
jgi:hypothetical protein